MSLPTTKKLLVTHNASFHADDVFATAALSILLDGNIDVVRTRDEELFQKADYVYDVGGEYDPARNRFDHHQIGGAGQRANGIPYAAFGLVWKTYGEQICGSQEVADKLDAKLVQPIDANDNGVDLVTLKTDLVPYGIQDVFFAFRPAYNEASDYDTPFFKLVELAREILEREIFKMKGLVDAESVVRTAYEHAPDKRVIILDGQYPWGETLGSQAEPLYVIYPKADTWRVECMRKEKFSFETRKPLPESWAGLRDEELASATGVSDAVFCHNGRWMVVSKSKEGALELARKALEN